jgi:hypothetical protein
MVRSTGWLRDKQRDPKNEEGTARNEYLGSERQSGYQRLPDVIEPMTGFRLGTLSKVGDFRFLLSALAGPRHLGRSIEEGSD